MKKRSFRDLDVNFQAKETNVNVGPKSALHNSEPTSRSIIKTTSLLASISRRIIILPAGYRKYISQRIRNELEKQHNP
ncbi:MAG TPA: hypothetical protein DCR61_06950 [Verrucomicrobiales bacterium]|nr:hypothetical protein [Pedosphaera sp.]HAQ99077.1 hypothetical protein [Verrucomicrobiales bacterium]HBP55648.1 hypothetical protein [Verrucomicrobiales bacterium]HCP38921.1 hypothetical protein [Verrucomicrobiales bacterium]HCZ03031.1 hypothetical protein [Verrucomicrobiales bacterium]